MSDANTPHYLDRGPRRALSLEAAHRRADVARVLRLAFFAGVGLIAMATAVYLLWPRGTVPAAELEAGGDTEAGAVRAEGLRLSGFDTEGRPFEILAETAIRRTEAQANITDLDALTFYDGVQDGENPGQGRVQARTGVFDADSKILQLETDVDLRTESGYAFRTDNARIYIDERRAEGDNEVTGEGPAGTVRADRWSYEDNGQVLHFEGNVRTVFDDSGDQGEAAASPGEEE